MRLIIAVAALVAALVSCNSGDYKKYTNDPVLYSKTVKRLNDIVLENNFPPMIASRNYVYANIAAFECIAAGDSSFRSLAGQIRHMPEMPKAVSDKPVDYQFAALLAFTKVGNAVTFPEGSMMGYYQELLDKADDAGMPDDVIDNTVAYSDAVFKAIMEWSKKDNYAQTRSASKYTVTDEEGRWVPTPPSYTSALEAHWMEIRTMVLDSAAQCKPVAAPAFKM
jgi:hypothetical protein